MLPQNKGIKKGGKEMEKNLGQCAASVYDSQGFGRYSPCQKPAKVERDGKWFCTIHDPEYIKAKQIKWQADFNKKWIEDQKLHELTVARKFATLGLTLQELRQVTPGLIRNALKAKK